MCGATFIQAKQANKKTFLPQNDDLLAKKSIKTLHRSRAKFANGLPCIIWLFVEFDVIVFNEIIQTHTHNYMQDDNDFLCCIVEQIWWRLIIDRCYFNRFIDLLPQQQQQQQRQHINSNLIFYFDTHSHSAFAIICSLLLFSRP